MTNRQTVPRTTMQRSSIFKFLLISTSISLTTSTTTGNGNGHGNNYNHVTAITTAAAAVTSTGEISSISIQEESKHEHVCTSSSDKDDIVICNDIHIDGDIDGDSDGDGPSFAKTKGDDDNDDNNLNPLQTSTTDEITITKTEMKMKAKTDTTKLSETQSLKSNIRNNLISTYLHLLAEHEVLTKCITSGVIGIIGDFCAQCFEYNMSGNRNRNHPTTINTSMRSSSDSSSSSTSTIVTSNSHAAFNLDKIRLFAIFFESTLVSGPLMHYAYDYMEYMVPVHDDDDDDKGDDKGDDNGDNGNNNKESIGALSKWAAATFHVVADCTVLGPVFVFTMMLFTSIIEGRIMSFTSELTSDYGPALWASSMASLGFAPIQLLAFKHFPIKFRLLYMNCQDIVWNAVVSFMAHKSRK